MNPADLHALAAAKSARELAEDKPGTQHREPWRHLLDAMVEAMTGEERRRVAAELGGKATEPWECPWCNMMISGSPRKCPQCGAGIVYGGPPLSVGWRGEPTAEAEPERAPDPDPAERKCGCGQSSKLKIALHDILAEVLEYRGDTRGPKELHDSVQALVRKAVK